MIYVIDLIRMIVVAHTLFLFLGDEARISLCVDSCFSCSLR
jgi:hypothetical protein